MKKSIVLMVFAVLAIYVLNDTHVSNGPTNPASQVSGDDARLLQAYENQQSNVQVDGEGVVARIFSDDKDGRTYQ